MHLYSLISNMHAQFGTPTSIKNSKQSCKLFKAHVGITEFKQINWLPLNYRFRQCLAANVFQFFDDKCPLYMRDVFDKPCISQTSKRNCYETKSTIKENQKWSTLYLFLGSISLEQLAEWSKTLHQFKYV